MGAVFPEEMAVKYMLPEPEGNEAGVCGADSVRFALGASHWARTLLHCDSSSNKKKNNDQKNKRRGKGYASVFFCFFHM